MSRRSAAFILVAALALVLALVPWTVSSERVKAAVARQIQNEYGLRLQVQGRATVTLLPVPRLKLADVVLSEEAGVLSARASELKGDLRLKPLLAARLQISDLGIVNAEVSVAHTGAGAEGSWPAMLDRLRRRLASGTAVSSHIVRLAITGSRIVVGAALPAKRTVLDKVHAVVEWPEPGGDMAVSGSAEWEGESVALSIGGLNPSRLLSRVPDAIEVTAATRLGRMNAVGNLTWGTSPNFAGLVAGQTPSLGALARWTGLGLDLQEFDRPVELGGLASLGPNEIEWPRAVLGFGGSRLEGALAYRFATPRPQLRATLAGEDLDLGWALAMADTSRIDPPHGDYDVRLSAADMRLGPFRLGDVATGILVSGERLEISLARASLAGGSIRGRISAALDGEGRDIRGQVSLDGVDLEKLFAHVGPMRGISGLIGAQMSFEALGDRQPELAQLLRGRVTLTARDGAIEGITLADPSSRFEGRLQGPAAAPRWRGGKTRYGQAAITLDVGRGTAEITDGTIDTASTQTRLKGSVSLPDGALALQTTTWGMSRPAAAEPRPTLVLDVRGTFDHPTVTAGREGGVEPVSDPGILR